MATSLEYVPSDDPDGGLNAPSDGQLVRTFIKTRDEGAFEAIVRRHGPMVLGVCRRLLGNEHDAADAFQAVFLVLARKASGIRTPEVLGAWLYNVAYRTSVKARTVIHKRKTREGQVSAMPEPAVESEAVDDVLEVLDHELRALPEIYQQPVILCELQGRSRREVAAALRIAEGTLSSRLATARKKLAERLRRRGITVSATALGVILAQSVATAAVPAPLLAATVKSAGPAALGQAGAGGASANALLLSDAIVSSMFLSKLKLFALALLAPFLLGAALQIGLGLVADEPDDQAAALAVLKKLGARLHWEIGPTGKKLARIELQRTPVRDEHLPTLHVFRELKELWLHDTAVTDVGCVHLGKLASLQSLRLSGTRITDAGLKPLAAIPRLRALAIGDTAVTDAGMKELADAGDLRDLDVRHTAITDAGLKNIARISKLNTLQLGKTRVTDAGMKELIPLRQLRTLRLENTAVTDKGLPDLAAIPSLESLSFDGDPGVTDAGVKLLAPLERLAAINLSGTKTTDVGVRELATFKSLGWLALDRTRVTGAGFEEPAHFTKLETLWLNESAVSDATAPTVAGLTSLRTLSLGKTDITDKAIKSLCLLTRLESLTLEKTRVTDACLTDLARLPHLWLLNVSITQVTDAGLARFAEFPQLRWLGLHDTKVTDDGLRHLTPLRNLDTLWLSWTKVTDEGLKHIAPLGNLRTLRLGGCKVTDAGLKTLGPLSQLHILWLDWTSISNEGLKELAPLTQLEELRLEGTAVSDAGLQHLARLQKLRSVELPQANVTEAAVTQLRTTLPSLAVNTPTQAEEGAAPEGNGAFWWLFAILGILLGVGLLAWSWFRGRKVLVPAFTAIAMAGLVILGYRVLDVLTPPAAPQPFPETGPKLRILKGHTGPVSALRFTPDMKRLISTGGWPGNDFTVRFWDLETDQEHFRIKASGPVGSVEISADGKAALVGSNGAILFIDIESGQILKKLRINSPTGSVAFAADGKHVFSSSHDGFARRWNLEQEQEVNRYKVNGKWCRYVAELPDGRVVTADNAGLIQIWDAAGGAELSRIDSSAGWVSSALLAPGGGQLLVGSWNAHLWDLATGQKLRAFKGHGSDLSRMAFSPDGKKLFTASFDGTVRLWDFETGNQIDTPYTQDEFVIAVTLSLDGRLIATGGGGTKEGNNFRPGTDHAIRILDVSHLTAAAGDDATTGGGAWPWWGWSLVGLTIVGSMTLAGIVFRRRGAVFSFVTARAGSSKSERSLPSVLFTCPECGATLRTSARFAGKKVKCPKCGATARVEGDVSAG